MTKSIKKEECIFRQIVNSLILNSAFCSNLGLIHGKMGQSIFFSHLFEHTRDRLYENISIRLMNEIYDEISSSTNTDFEDGLAGIGWGIEYLVQKGFFFAETDEILRHIDRKIGQVIKYDVDNIGLLTGYCGYAFYLLKRLESKKSNRDSKVIFNLRKLAKLTVRKIIAIMDSDGFKFDDLPEFDLFWDPIVLILLQLELSKIIELKILSDDLLKSVISKLTDNSFCSDKNNALIKLLINYSTGFNDSRSNYLIKDLIFCFEKSEYKNMTLRYSFLGVYLLLRMLYYEKDHQKAYDKVDRFLIYFINRQEIKVSAYDKLKSWGVFEGLCGLGIPFLLSLISKSFKLTHSKRIFKRTKKEKLTVIFFPYWYSGAGTYSSELLQYLRVKPEIQLYIVTFSSEIDEYSFATEKDCINIMIPVNRQFHDNVRFLLPSETLSKNYFTRVAEILDKNLSIPRNSIFHFNHPSDFSRLIPIVKKKFGCKTVLSSHFFTDYFTKQEIKNKEVSSQGTSTSGDKKLCYKDLSEFDGIICVSHFGKEILTKDFDIPSEKIRVIWNGTSYWKPNTLSDGDRQELRKKFGLDHNKKIILYSGRLEPRKGIEELIFVIGELCKRYDNIYFIFAGSGDFESYLPMCRDFIGKVSFTGNLQREELQQLYYIANIGIIPSRWELFGYVLIEMMHSRLPVIATNVPGMNEIMELFTDPIDMVDVNVIDDNLIIDKQKLCSVISSYIENPRKMELNSMRGLQCAQKIFTRDKMGLKTVRYYKKLVKQN